MIDPEPQIAEDEHEGSPGDAAEFLRVAAAVEEERRETVRSIVEMVQALGSLVEYGDREDRLAVGKLVRRFIGVAVLRGIRVLNSDINPGNLAVEPPTAGAA